MAMPREETTMDEVAEERRAKLSDTLRRARAERVDNQMLARLEAERRLQLIDQRMLELSEMKALLKSKLDGEQREAIP
jgi:hypothetical protein